MVVIMLKKKSTISQLQNSIKYWYCPLCIYHSFHGNNVGYTTFETTYTVTNSDISHSDTIQNWHLITFVSEVVAYTFLKVKLLSPMILLSR